MPKYAFLLTLVATFVVGCNRNAKFASIEEALTAPSVEPSTSASVSSTGAFYTVADYDPERDADADLSMTIEFAKASNKKIILEIGGNW